MGGVNKKKAGKNKGGKGGEKPKRSTPPHKEVRMSMLAPDIYACFSSTTVDVLHMHLLARHCRLTVSCISVAAS